MSDEEAGEKPPSNVFDRTADVPKVPVVVEIDGKKTTVGEAAIWTDDDGFVWANAVMKTDNPEDVKKLFEHGITGVSIADVAPDITEDEAQALFEFEPHDHNPVQHRDARAPWCDFCGLTVDLKSPRRNFGSLDSGPKGHFGKPRGQFGMPAPADDIHRQDD